MKRLLPLVLLLALLPFAARGDLGVGTIFANVANTWTAIQTYTSGVSSNFFQSSGTTFTLGAGTGACATSSTLTGGASGGSFLCTGTAGASTQVVNLPTAAHAWACWANDDTSKVGWAAGAAATNAITLSGTIATTSDKVVFGCMGF